MIDAISYHLRFYGRFIAEQWRDMTPMAYGTLLIGIAVFGWLFMKSGTKGPGS
jgi:hypothetical protein